MTYQVLLVKSKANCSTVVNSGVALTANPPVMFPPKVTVHPPVASCTKNSVQMTVLPPLPGCWPVSTTDDTFWLRFTLNEVRPEERSAVTTPPVMGICCWAKSGEAHNNANN